MRKTLADGFASLTKMREANSAPTLVQPRLARCPHCGIATPYLVAINSSATNQLHVFDGSNGNRSIWAIYWCRNCGGVITICSTATDVGGPLTIQEIFPGMRDASGDLPDSARRYLQQAMDSLSSPDAAVMMANSAVDAMLKAKGYKEGTQFFRINKARDEGLLTPDMAAWAHEVRLVGNDARHADEENPHAPPEQAWQMVEFAEALGEFLFVLPARIKRARGVGGTP